MDESGRSALLAAYALVILQTFLVVFVAIIRFWMLGGWTKGKGAFGISYDILFIISVVGGVGGGIVLSYVCGLIICHLSFDENLQEFKIPAEIGYLRDELLLGNAALYLVSMYALKLAFLILYWALYARVGTLKMWPIYATFAFLLVAFLANFIAYFLVCGGRLPGGSEYLIKCIPLYHLALQTATNVVGLVTDFILLVLPLRLLNRLPGNSRAEKYARIFVIFVGSLSIVATIVRYSILNASGTLSPGGLSPEGSLTMNPQRSLALLATFSMAEISAAITAFALPSLQPVLKQAIRKRRAPKEEELSYTGMSSGSF